MKLDALINIISEITKVDAGEITKDTVLATDLALDSLEMFKLVTEIEARLDIMINMSELKELATVDELYNYFYRR
ncbi:MAG: acyl carrier protein [Clostridiales bacterium]|nr:acyl carrier protein [Clostridiales bacterium]